MKVCVISTPVFKVPCSGYSGLEVIAWNQAKGLAEKGHNVSMVAPDGSECPGVSMITCGKEGTWDEKSFYQKYWQELLKFDVIIDHSWQKWSYVLKVEGRLKAPVLGVLHAPVNTMYQTLPTVEKPCFVCISDDQKAHFDALFAPVTAKRAYNGVDLSFYKPLDVPRSDRFLFLARFSTIKGPHIAIEACRNAKVGLDLIGDTSITNEPDYLKKCQEMCNDYTDSLNIGDSYNPSAFNKRIKMVGPATRGECVWWFSQAFCMLHPVKNFREPFGLTLVEANACGCPVIVWDNGACREIIRQCETGFLVRSEKDLENCITVMANEGLMGFFQSVLKTREACVENANRFTIQKMVDRYDELIKEAVEGGW